MPGQPALVDPSIPTSANGVIAQDFRAQDSDDFVSRLGTAKGDAPVQKPDQHGIQKHGQPDPKTVEDAKKAEAEEDHLDPDETAQKPDKQIAPEDAAKKEKARAKWGELKQAAKERDELKARMEAREKELEWAKDWDEPKRSEAQEALKWRAAFQNRSQPEYIQNVTQPYMEREQSVKDFADYAGIDADTLLRTLAEPNDWKRNQAISTLIDSSTAEMDAGSKAVISTMVKEMRGYIAKGHELDQKAEELRQAYMKDEQRKQVESKNATSQKFAKAREEMVEEIFAKKYPELMKDQKFVDQLKNVEMSDDPRDQAYNAQAGVALALAHEAHKSEVAALKKELADIKATLEKRSAGDPRTHGGAKEGNGSQPFDKNKPVTRGQDNDEFLSRISRSQV